MNKKTIMSIAMFATILLTAAHAHAQTGNRKFSFGFGLDAGLPTGDFKQVYGAAVGLTLRASYKAGPGYATLTAGGLIYTPKSFDGVDPKAGIQVPVKAGYKFIYKDHFFAMGEIGFSSFHYYFEDYNGDLASVSQSGLTIAPGIGYQTGKFEIGLRYEATRFTGSTLGTFMLRTGFNF